MHHDKDVPPLLVSTFSDRNPRKETQLESFAQGLTLNDSPSWPTDTPGNLILVIPCAGWRTPIIGDWALEIVDHYQADVARPMRSLSGGESFLASLALALGLSEPASGRATIESLFIDKGFDSLDTDRLETAMAVWENLQAGGKIIGVISHVSAMQERITTQIKVTKKSSGCSRVDVVG